MMCGYEGCSRNFQSVKYGIRVCEIHEHQLAVDVGAVFARRIYKMYEDKRLTSHASGITYIVLLPNKNIKIGYTRDYQTLVKRLQTFHRTFGDRVELLATMLGGETMEAYLHHKFVDDRLYHLSLEQFRPSKEILSFANETGLEANGLLAVEIYKNYIPKAQL